jgi:hypothetical protein
LVVTLATNVAVATPNARDASAEIVAQIATVGQTMKSTKYVHFAHIDVKNGVYEWDCSLMVAWILRRAAPRARAAIGAERPLARDFYNAIARAPTVQPRWGWMRISGPSQALPGDVFAWIKPAMFRNRNNTGHVGFVISAPWSHPKFASVWLMRIADATRQLHGDDSRPVDGEGGFGTATIAFLVDANDAPLAYGWYGADQDPSTFVPTKIVLGRVFR